MIDHFSLDTPSTLADRLHGDLTRMAGMITEVRKLYTRKDQKPMASFRIESLQGSVERSCFPKHLKRMDLWLTMMRCSCSAGAY